MAADSLWPDDIGETNLVTPVSIMREQAAALGPRTGNLVTADVRTRSQGAVIVHAFFLEAPAMSYSYEVFEANHRISLYPVTVTFKGSVHRCEDERSFREMLAQILRDDNTKRIVQSLIAQSRG
jgi:hypothetical protein